MCEFCDNQRKELIPDEDKKHIKEMIESGDEVYFYCSVYLEGKYLYFDSSCKEYPHSKIRISFCPICGRKLTDQ